MSVEFEDNATPTLIRLFDVSSGIGMQSLSKGASDVQKRMESDSRNAGTTEYHQRIVKGHRVIVKDSTKSLYDRYDHETGEKLIPMGELIRFRQYPYSNTVLVGFLDTKAYNTLRYVAGVSSPHIRIDGTQTKAIAKRMAEGGRIELSQKQRGMFRHSGFYGIAKKGYIIRKAHPFMNFVTYLGIIEDRAQREWRVAIKQFKMTA